MNNIFDLFIDLMALVGALTIGRVAPRWRWLRSSNKRALFWLIGFEVGLMFDIVRQLLH